MGRPPSASTLQILIPPSLKKRLQHFCVDHGLHMSQAVREAIEEYLGKKEQGPS